MTERFMFFDSANALEPDRTYNAQEFTDYFKALVTTGIMRGSGNELKVATSGSNMVTTIDTGIAFLTGRFYENDSLLTHTHDTEALGKNRIDRIVIRMDLNTEARYVKSFVKKGVGSVAPVAPDLQRDANVYEISLAQVKVIGGQTFINVADVTDERGNDVIAPWAGSRILPNFDDESVLIELVNKADKQLEPSFQVILNNGWSHGSNFSSPLICYKDPFGIVHLQGTTLSNGGTTSLATLPNGYRPTRRERFLTLSDEVDYTPNLIEIRDNGEIHVGVPKNLSFSIAFRTY